MIKLQLPNLPPVGPTPFTVPELAHLRRAECVGGFMSMLAEFDETITKSHHQMVYLGICRRYEFALKVAADKKAFAAFSADKRIRTLPRPPKEPSGTLRGLFQATYADPGKASKYFKRVEKFWAKPAPVEDVSAFLDKHGLNDPPRELPAADVEERGAQTKQQAETKKRGAAGKRSPGIEPDHPPCGVISDWPGNVELGRTYNLKVKVFEHESGATNFELLEIPELLT